MTESEPKANEIEALLLEHRTFDPSQEFRRQASARDPGVYAQAANDPETFWASFARELDWIRPYDRVLDWKPPDARWFLGGRLNVSANCLDRHLHGARRHKAALIWEGEPGDSRVYTYQQLHYQVCKFANAMKKLGVGRGDRVCIYLPMIPEAAIAMLACARIGAVHSVVFGGFSADALRDRIQDAGAKLLVTADGGWRRGQIVQLKRMADEALADCPTIQNVILVKRGDFPCHVKEGRDHWWHRVMDDVHADCPYEAMDSEAPLYILYTSGTTGKPKGILHTTAGYLTGVYATTKWVFDLKDEDLFWCTADVGWVTGHSYVVYGPLANGATVLMYEGSPDWPDKDRFWQMIEKYRVNVFYTAPTAIRAFMKWGPEFPERWDLSSLRLLGSVGEPINPEAWMWYHEHIGKKKCPIVDTWWQTETGHILISPLPGLTRTKPGSATMPLPGVDACVLNESGEEVSVGGGFLVVRKPWPGMLRGIWGNRERFVKGYFSKFPGVYFTGDGAKKDEDGYMWLLGRVDDVMNVAGHRIGTMEVESALVDFPKVAEAAVVGIPHELKGTAIAAFVTLKSGHHGSDEVLQDLKDHVVQKIGAIARPDKIFFTADLPKTRSGKIMRRLLRDIAEGRALGDTTTLADPGVVKSLKEQYEDKES
ncbi:MAG: acetate--CoA ligase [Acidobacteria bacterium]|nr:acetate--CoA ligase [Acidobacteriota bacterium]